MTRTPDRDPDRDPDRVALDDHRALVADLPHRLGPAVAAGLLSADEAAACLRTARALLAARASHTTHDDRTPQDRGDTPEPNRSSPATASRRGPEARGSAG